MARDVHAWLKARRSAILADLKTLVAMDSESGSAEPLRQTAAWLAEWFSKLDQVQVLEPVPDRAPHLALEIGSTEPQRTPLVLCHYDTVWPEGTAAAWPFKVYEDVASGPGVLDMKASIVMCRYALEAIASLEVCLEAGVRVFISADEEIGNPTSESLIVDLAKRSNVTFVLEPPLADGRLKTARKSYASVRIAVRGRSSHAGIDPEYGRNAAIEAARLALAADALADDRSGTTVNVGVLRAGHQANVVPDTAELVLDIRCETPAETNRVFDALKALAPSQDEMSIDVLIDVNRPPMLRTVATDRLLGLARRVSEGVDVRIDEGSTGGASEGNLTQAAGTPTLDGLGAVGVGPHTYDESIQVSSLLSRSALLAGLLVEVSGNVWPRLQSR